MRVAISLVVLAGLAWQFSPSLASGQTLLQRLEGRLNQVLPPAAEPTPAALPAPSNREPGYLGLYGDDSATAGKGIQIEEVYAGSPAAKAGLRVGDIITAINGKSLKTTKEMGDELATAAAGAKLSFTVQRDGQPEEVAVTLGMRPAEAARDEEDPGPPPTAAPPAPAPATRLDPALSGRASLGITASPLTEELRARYGTTVRRGALITAIRPGTPADRVGLPVGGVVVAVDGRRIDSSDELIAAVRTATPGQEMELTYYHGDKLARKTVRLAPATAAVAPGLGPEPRPGGMLPGAGAPGADRPLLRKVEQLVDNIARNGAGGVAVDVGPDPRVPVGGNTAALQQQIDLLQEEVRSLHERVQLLESKLAEPRGEAGPRFTPPPPLPRPPSAP